jgi:hypothetical protein
MYHYYRAALTPNASRMQDGAARSLNAIYVGVTDVILSSNSEV